MSEREDIQNTLVGILENQKTDKGYPRFNAPYGVLTGLRKMGRGKVRSITFGVSRYLDAEITIFSPKRIEITGQGGLAYMYEGRYGSVEEVIEALKK